MCPSGSAVMLWLPTEDVGRQGEKREPAILSCHYAKFRYYSAKQDSPKGREMDFTLVLPRRGARRSSIRARTDSRIRFGRTTNTSKPWKLANPKRLRSVITFIDGCTFKTEVPLTLSMVLAFSSSERQCRYPATRYSCTVKSDAKAGQGVMYKRTEQSKFKCFWL